MMLQVAQRLQNSKQPGTPQLYLCECARGRVWVLLPCQQLLLLLLHEPQPTHASKCMSMVAMVTIIAGMAYAA